MAEAFADTHPSKIYAHALAAERQAVKRYYEFADHLETRGDESTAHLFRQLGHAESEHASAIARQSGNRVLPGIGTWEHDWVANGPLDGSAQQVLHHLMTPYDALKIALSAEQRAKTFFEHVLAATTDEEARAIAKEMIDGESDRIIRIQKALTAVPPPLDWEQDFERIHIRP